MKSRRKKALVSACLLGRKCRYDGRDSIEFGLIEKLAPDDIVPVCPEEMGGLGTPREPAEIREGEGSDVLDGKARVVDRTGRDVTDAFIAGAQKALEEGLREGVRVAYLKTRSPSCGPSGIAARGGIRKGRGVFAELLRRQRIKMIPCEGGKP